MNFINITSKISYGGFLMKTSINKNNIKAILFDSGRVLNVSCTGHWFITPNFFTYVDKQLFSNISKSRIDTAFNKAGDYINSQKLIVDETEEYTHFFKYYCIFAKYLPELKLTEEDITNITKDYVYNPNKYRFFEDAINVIPKLSKAYKLAVISDAWPSLENVFRNVSLRDYFSSFVISSKLGITKPNELMYKTALEELDILPCEAIFIDDNKRNCDGAEKLGITSFLLCRDKQSYIYNKIIDKNQNIIRNLEELEKTLL